MSTTDVTFSAAGAMRKSTILNQAFTIHSLTIDDPTPVTINSGAGGPYTLTISGNAGTGITVNTGADLLTIGANVTLSGSSNTIAVNNTAGAILNGTLGGGSLIKTGAGTLTLAGANTFTRNTLASGGTLRLTNNLALQNSALDTSGAGVITLSAVTTPTLGGLIGGKNLAAVITTGYSSVTVLTLNLGTGVTDSYSGVIAEGAAGMTLIKTGLGTQILNGASTYTGGTTLAAGTIGIGNSSALGTGTVTVAAGGGSIYAAGASQTMSNAFFLNGGLTIVNDPTGAHNLTLSGPLTGGGGLTMNGTGALTLTGSDNYAGDTFVNHGSLLIDGSMASPNMTVAPGAFLGGFGYLGGNLNNNGVVNPGDAPGKLGVNGNFTQSSTGTLIIRIGGIGLAQHDLLAVGGKASLAGALQLQQYNGFQFKPGDKVTFLTAGGGVSGKFSAVADPFLANTLVGLDLVYLSNSVLLEAEQTSFTAIPRETPNQQAVAYALDASLSDRRVQGAQPGRVAIYSRNREDITESYPELVEAFAQVRPDIDGELIFDGEILGWDFVAAQALPFAVLGQRIGRKRVGNEWRQQVPVVFMAFDLMFAGGELLLPKPLRDRRNQLEAVVEALVDRVRSPLILSDTAERRKAAQASIFAEEEPEPELLPRLILAPSRLVESAEEIDGAYTDARARANEGVMLKAAGSAYLPGRRGLAWVKLKRELATLDVVITGAEYGHGKRAGLLSDYTFAVRAASGELENVGKAYSGVTDVEIAELTEFLKAHTIQDVGHFRTVEPLVILEVAFNNIMRSDRHASGFALRFPRILRIRSDKPLSEIDTVERVEEIYQSQVDKPVE